MISIVDHSHSISAESFAKAQASLSQVLSRTDVGFYQVPNRQGLWQQVVAQADALKKQADDLVVVGIGGSSLGPKALYEIFQQPKNPKKIHFCDNVDAIEFERLWQGIRDFKKTVWVFISKSGSTIETLVAADLIFQKYSQLGFEPICKVVSENRSNPLTDWAKSKNVDCLEIPIDVGGRYSVLTAVGMLPMAFLGVDVLAFQKGAQKLLQSAKSQEDLANFMAQVVDSFHRQEWISFFWFYSSQYQNFGRWLLQLWAESLGKQKDQNGNVAPRVSTPVTAIGAIDQHSVLQQVMDGAKDKFVVFSRFSDIENSGEVIKGTQFANQEFFKGHKMGDLISAQAQGTKAALNEAGVSTLTLRVHGVDAESVGYQLLYWQLVVAGVGQMLNINPFDQPGVELGKRLAKKILKS